jgi:hypothetical protein
MRKTIALLSLVFLLAGCSGSGSSSSQATCKQQYWDGTIGVCLPTNWKVVDHETLQSRGVPDEVIAAFQTSQVVAGQNPTVTVTKETLQSDLDPVTYSQASIRAVASLPAYKMIDTRAVKIGGKNLELHVFSAKPLPEEPERRFYQLSTTSKSVGYTLTALTPLSVSSSLETEVLTIMRSITFTDPAEASSAAK